MHTIIWDADQCITEYYKLMRHFTPEIAFLRYHSI